LALSARALFTQLPRLTIDPSSSGNKPSINLNHAVVKLDTEGSKISKVAALDLLAKKVRSYQAKYVVLAAGTVESAKLIKLSGLTDPSGLVGVGITDHPTFFTHFSVPPGKPWHRIDASSKTLSRHKEASATAHPYNMLLELGADLNQGRYLDADTVRRHNQMKHEAMLCEIVFLFNSPLVPSNRLELTGLSSSKPAITMQDSASADEWFPEVDDIKDQVIAELEGEELPGEDLELKRAVLQRSP
jgi:hypothetical protein